MGDNKLKTFGSKYLHGVPENYTKIGVPPAFGYESTGTETYFRDMSDPDYRSRRVFSFHSPKTLYSWSKQDKSILDDKALSILCS